MRIFKTWGLSIFQPSDWHLYVKIEGYLDTDTGEKSDELRNVDSAMLIQAKECWGYQKLRGKQRISQKPLKPVPLEHSEIGLADLQNYGEIACIVRGHQIYKTFSWSYQETTTHSNTHLAATGIHSNWVAHNSVLRLLSNIHNLTPIFCAKH